MNLLLLGMVIIDPETIGKKTDAAIFFRVIFNDFDSTERDHTDKIGGKTGRNHGISVHDRQRSPGVFGDQFHFMPPLAAVEIKAAVIKNVIQRHTVGHTFLTAEAQNGIAAAFNDRGDFTVAQCLFFSAEYILFHFCSIFLLNKGIGVGAVPG